MIIGIDAREIQDEVKTGIGRALTVFLDYFRVLDDQNRVILFSSKLLPITLNHRVSSIIEPEYDTFLWDQIVLVKLLKKHGVNLFYSPYYKIPLFCPSPVVSAIFDLMYIYFIPYKKKMSLCARLYYRTIGTLMAHRTNAIFTCSEYSKNDILRYYRVDPDKVKVIPIGLDEIYQPVTDQRKINDVKQKFGIRGEYVLYAGNFKPHKNVETVIESFRMISSGFPLVKLVLAGPKDAHYERVRPCIDEKNTIVTGTVSLEDQVVLYSGAKLFIIASLYEGFGFPPLEAMACGTPVVSSNAGSLPEVVGDAGILVDGKDAAAFAGKMKEVLSSPGLRKKLSASGVKRAAEFTQKKYSRQLYEWLIACAGPQL